MTLGNKLAKLRRENNLTQEQLAELLGVSRQAISKWESDAAYPETEKLIRLGRLYRCSMDYLLLDEIREESLREESPKEPQAPVPPIPLTAIGYERVSKKTIGTLPLWHINIGFGRVAKGVFAVGLVSKGIISLGLCSVGAISLGLFSVGVLAFGAFAAGLIALGSIAVGILAAGAVAVGAFSLGACAIGEFSIGAAAIGQYAAMGDAARAPIALGFSEAVGSRYQALGAPGSWDMAVVQTQLTQSVPGYLSFFRDLFLRLIGS